MLLLYLTSRQHNHKHENDRTMECQSNVTSASTAGGKGDIFTECTKFINLDCWQWIPLNGYTKLWKNEQGEQLVSKKNIINLFNSKFDYGEAPTSSVGRAGVWCTEALDCHRILIITVDVIYWVYMFGGFSVGYHVINSIITGYRYCVHLGSYRTYFTITQDNYIGQKFDKKVSSLEKLSSQPV